MKDKSQQPAPIPDDLKGDYRRACMQHKGHRGYVAGLIERIATLTEERDTLRKALAYAISECDARDYRASLGGYDQLNQLREILIRPVSDAALSTPLGTPGSTKGNTNGR